MAAAACALAVVWPIADVATEVAPRPVPAFALAPIPGWQPVGGENLLVRPAAASAWSQSFYQRDGRTVGVAVAYYQAQDARRKLVRISASLFANEDSHFVRTTGGQRSVALGRGQQRVVETHAQTPARQPIVLWEWYWVDGRTTQSNALAKLLVGWSRLAHHRDDSAAVMLFTADEGNRGSEALAQFARDAWPEIHDALLRNARS